MKTFIVLMALVAFLFGCSNQKGVGPQTQDICEAVFRYQIEQNASGAQEAKAYFLYLFEDDPSWEFLNRFEGHDPPVKKGSEFEIGKGLLFDVYGIKRVNKKKVEVSGGFYKAEEGGSKNTFVVEKIKGKWIVTENTILELS